MFEKANILFVVPQNFVGLLLFQTANVLPFDMDERSAGLPNCRSVVGPHHDVRILTKCLPSRFRGLRERRLDVLLEFQNGNFDTYLAAGQSLLLKFRNQALEYKEVHNFAFTNVPWSTSEITD